MFGLEGQKKKKPTQNFDFELEKEIIDPQIRKKLQQRVEGRIQRIKDLLRNGDEKDEYNRLGSLLQGYQAILKVMSRVLRKNNQ